MLYDQAYFLKACEKIGAGYTPGGAKTMTYWSGISIAKMLESMAGPDKNDLIVDIGSGNGRLAMGLYTLGYVRYIGLEIIPQCVEFCKRTFSRVVSYKFIQQPNTNEHYYQGSQPAEAVQYPIEDRSVDLVAAFSFFSHTKNYKIAEAHLNEIGRILKPGGKLLSTWFFGDELFEEKRTVYDQKKIEALLADRGAITFAEASLHGIAGHDQIVWVSQWKT